MYATFPCSYQVAECLKRTKCHLHQLLLQFQFTFVGLIISDTNTMPRASDPTISVSNLFHVDNDRKKLRVGGKKGLTVQMKLSTEKTLMDLENRFVVAKGEGERVGWTGNLGLIDADYCIWSGEAMRSCSTALGTISSHL